jgi:hypothetical protein
MTEGMGAEVALPWSGGALHLEKLPGPWLFTPEFWGCHSGDQLMAKKRGHSQEENGCKSLPCQEIFAIAGYPEGLDKSQ